MVADTTNFAGSMKKEYEKRIDTYRAKQEILRNSIRAMLILIGDKVLPVLIKMIDNISGIVLWLVEFTEKNQGLATVLYYTISILLTAIVVMYLFGKAIAIATFFNKVLRAKIALMNIVMWKFLLLAGALAIIGYILYRAFAPVFEWLYDKFDWFSNMIDSIVEKFNKVKKMLGIGDDTSLDVNMDDAAIEKAVTNSYSGELDINLTTDNNTQVAAANLIGDDFVNTNLTQKTNSLGAP